MNKIITWEELSQHNKRGDYWICIEGNVYDVSTYLAEHPGGDDILIKHAGKDATKGFNNENHTQYAISLRNKFLVGKIEDKPIPMEAEIQKQPEKTIKVYTYEEVAKHNTPTDCWIVIHGKVYDPVSFLNEHPGGPTVITNRAGKDATKAFDEVGHTELANKQMKGLLIGTIKEGELPPNADEGASDKLNFKQILLLIVGLIIGLGLFYMFNSN